MFERRLKIFLIILGLCVGGLLVRAAQLQIVQRDYWRKEATDALKKVSFLGTERGAIVDRKGRELAADRPCVDACVEYRAIVYPADPKWLAEVALQRLRARMGDAWKQLPKKRREELRKAEAPAVQKDIDATWDKLAELSEQPREDIERTRQDILRLVELRKKYAWFHAYQQAMKKGGGDIDESKIEKWLTPDGEDAAEIDKFSISVAEETAPHVILHAISLDVQNELGRHSERYPGLVLRPGLHRYYPYEDLACQVLGYLGRVSEKDRDFDTNKLDQRRAYLPNDDIGRGGLEWLCEPALRGTRGQVTTTYGQEASSVTEPPVPGKTVRTSIDVDLEQDIQSFFASATLHDPHGHPDRDGKYPILEEHALLHGAAVLLDVKTNQVLAMVSYPDYDLNHFDELYQELRDDEVNDRLRDRATESQLEPGSTVKPMVGLSAITAGVMKVNEGIECTGYLVLPWGSVQHPYSHLGRCWVASGFAQQLAALGMTPSHHPIPFPHHGHDGNQDGFLTYSDALERSCNVYFETVADRMGMDRLSDWMGRFGLGRRTGIGIEEYPGRVPKKEDHFANRRTTGFLSGIGQGFVAATPLQMANVVATIARGGIWMRPQLLMADPASGHLPATRPSTIPEPDAVDLHLDPGALAACRLGMINVVDGAAGTGKMAHMNDLLIAGKTGTAQAAEFQLLVHDGKGHPILKDGKKQYIKFVPSTSENPNAEQPWYRGSGTEGHYKLDHAWMIGYAPANDPKVAFAVLVEYGGSGGGAAVDVVNAALESCIAHGYLKQQQNPPTPTDEEPTTRVSAAPGSDLLVDVPPQR